MKNYYYPGIDYCSIIWLVLLIIDSVSILITCITVSEILFAH